MEISFCLNSNGKNLFFKPLVSLNIGDANHEFISQVGEDLSKETFMDIMKKVKHTADISTEIF